MRVRFLFAALLAGAFAVDASARAVAAKVGDSTADERSWMLVPLLSSDPKMGTSLGAMGAWLHKFDEQSPASMFGAMGTWSDSGSSFAGAFARSYFDQDHQRLAVFAARGEVNNNYKDFLGSGYPLDTTDNIDLFVTRYLVQVRKNTFVGLQALNTDYAVSSEDAVADGALELLGLNGFDSVGLGVVLQFDDRDNQNSPLRGRQFSLANVAYRENFGGSVDFDAYTLTAKYFIPRDDGKVIALHLDGRWTHDAPPSGYSSIRLRGYTAGQYLAPNGTTAEIEYRVPLRGRFGAQAFVGNTWLYGSPDSGAGSDGAYPAAGGGLNFAINPAERMVMRLDLAFGKDDNRGLYLQFGQAF